MNSRMDKYSIDTPEKEVTTRSEKNKRLYDEVQNMNVEIIDVDVKNDAIEIGTHEKRAKTRSDYQMYKEIENILPSKSTPVEVIESPKKEERVYDINEILKLARDNQLFEDDNKKRLINTEYNILTKLDVEKINEEEDLSKENLRKMIDNIYANEEKNNKVEKPKKKEPEEYDLFSELIEDSPTKIISEESSKDILDKNDDEKETEPKDEEITIEDIQKLEFETYEDEKEKQEENEDKKEKDEDKKKKKDKKKKEKRKKHKKNLFDDDDDDDDEKDDDEDDDDDDDDDEPKSKALLVIVIIVIALLIGFGVYLFKKYF